VASSACLLWSELAARTGRTAAVPRTLLATFLNWHEEEQGSVGACTLRGIGLEHLEDRRYRTV
jgi:hypothetical protein